MWTAIPRRSFPAPAYVGEIEQWYYNPGSQGLLRILLFQDGKLVRVDTDGRGFSRLIRGQCSPYELRVGMSKYELLARCGPPTRVAACSRRLQAADALLVIGSSLMVCSGYRFVRAARARDIPVALLNEGQTRADTEVSFQVVGRCAAVLSALVQRLEPA
ncbi:MAG: DUF2845 domain-containing protein [Nitrococcus mobilis]|nr:DUF2845 domain-containing protein [Nitrococcus mobilis]